jgi:hypothetical protein
MWWSMGVPLVVARLCLSLVCVLASGLRYVMLLMVRLPQPAFQFDFCGSSTL